VDIAAGEALPFASTSLGAVVLVVTLCFVSGPLGALREAERVLRSDGGLVLGVVFAEGPVGQEYQRKAAAGHPYYRHAHFFTRDELARLLVRAGFRPERSRAALLSGPAGASFRDGDDPDAGFTALLALPATATTVLPPGTSSSPS
jgi:SAM-dependent methyltransferase